ncbi:phosphatase PAP2 family protein [Vogesella sp. LIG4]|uniref:phosphatase PAP2 family protein n=1 Tax=Vogesella sp. LIG4 TaxID=1192162 RepID=UPI00081F9DF6|nr:phosphatase PAP2 family protein [Vogesella sp. LIG4]SCK26166.1 PAP2 superfamily protein [Vogesella sp. LIG4]
MFSWVTVTNFGSSALLLPFALAIALFLAAGRAWRSCLLWLVVFLFAVALVTVTKALFVGWGIGAHAIDFTGISGHAMLATAIFPTAAYLLLHQQTVKVRLWGAAAASLIGLFVAVSRVILKAHSLSEVTAGVLLGLLVSLIFIDLSRRFRESHPDGRILLLVFAMLFLALYGQSLPTRFWIRGAALSLAGHARPYVREVWHRSASATAEKCTPAPCHGRIKPGM